MNPEDRARRDAIGREKSAVVKSARLFHITPKGWHRPVDWLVRLGRKQ